MSKKKVTGSTMTLKDFHGGSIPTDLPLPSAPGVSMKALDRPSFDRTTSWGPMGRLDHRSRPHSSPGTRHFDDKSPFPAHSAHIGLNFDEDERKPLDGVTPPRRTICDDSIKVLPTRTELKPEYGLSGRQGLAPASQWPSAGVVNSFSGIGKSNEEPHVGVNYKNSVEQGIAGVPNAWQARKEVIAAASEPVQSIWSGPSAISKLAHASALEKVSSGRWQSKQSIHNQTESVIAGTSEQDTDFQPKAYVNNSYDRIDVLGAREFRDVTLASHAERGFNVEDKIQGHKHELPDYDRVGLLNYSATSERNTNIYSVGVQQVLIDEKSVGHELQAPVTLESCERPKLKLLPRSKPLESTDASVVDCKQGYQIVADTGPAVFADEMHGNVNPKKPSVANSESGKQTVERPKLNLKPRSQPIKQLEEKIESERNALFGGARPRETVLKERGVDDVAVNNHDFVHNSNRADHNVAKIEKVQGHTIPIHYPEKTENPPDQRIGKHAEKKDQKSDVERVDMQKKNWRNDNKRNTRGTERQQQLERLPSPETWRKPSDQLNPASPDSTDAVGKRYGKAASAVELAQAFSRSASDSKIADRRLSLSSSPQSLPGSERSLPGSERSLPGRIQMPFSRLTGPARRPQINGY